MSLIKMTVQQIVELDLWEKVCKYTELKVEMLNESNFDKKQIIEFDTTFKDIGTKEIIPVYDLVKTEQTLTLYETYQYEKNNRYKNKEYTEHSKLMDKRGFWEDPGGVHHNCYGDVIEVKYKKYLTLAKSEFLNEIEILNNRKINNSIQLLIN